MQQWILNGARAIGLSHRDEHIPCQDSVVTQTQKGVTVAVLSDGCGSAHFSHYGSTLITQKVSDYLCEHFDELYNKDKSLIKQELTSFILACIDTWAHGNHDIIQDYFNSPEGQVDYQKITHYSIMAALTPIEAQGLLNASLMDATVLFVAIKDNRCLLGHCGDGFILGYKDKEFCVLSEEPKMGERNETYYPSSVYYLSIADNTENYWDYFRIEQLDSRAYLGFTLMSDGAEKSLIHFKEGAAIPVKNNNALLYEIVSAETPAAATQYLTELLEQTYRSRSDADGDTIEITDDDVSVALIVDCQYKKTLEPTSSPEEMYYTSLLKSLLAPQGDINQDLYEKIDQVFKASITCFTEEPFDYDTWLGKLNEEWGCDAEEVALIKVLALKCGVITLEPFSINLGGEERG